MQYRTLGKTNLRVSVIGMGTAQLRMVPEKRAIETLIRGFQKGINIVHVAPDYEGAEYIIAKAISMTSRQVIVCGQGHDRQFHPHQPVSHFEMYFERLCRSLDTERLEIFGISCIDDRERFDENVWGPGGMVEFLQKKKEESRLGAAFCTTHGSPEYIASLIEKDIFDAIMIPYNLLGFHLLSSPAHQNENHENLIRNGTEILPMARKKNIGLMVMKTLAGGLMCRETPFTVMPSPERQTKPMQLPTAYDILRLTVDNAGIHSAVIGVTDPGEVDEIERAGDVQRIPDEALERDVISGINRLKKSLCSRCGECDNLCSRGLPVSWMIRAAYVAACSDEMHETWEEIEYFRLYEKSEKPCWKCPDQSCCCPSGINIPALLDQIHDYMTNLSNKGGLQPTICNRPAPCGDKNFGARLIYSHIPERISSGTRIPCRIFIENTGLRGWFKKENPYQAHVLMGIYVNGIKQDTVPIREETHPGERIHFSFYLTPAKKPGPMKLELKLLGEHFGYNDRKGIKIKEQTMVVTPAGKSRNHIFGNYFYHRNSHKLSQKQGIKTRQ